MYTLTQNTIEYANIRNTTSASFCPNNDILHPDRNLPLFGDNITCDMVQLFFNRMEVDENSQNCRLAQSVNYICGCEGTGYAGANTEAKQKALVWMPRVSAVLSIMVRR